MLNHDIPQRRLHTQHIAGTPLNSAAEVVGWLGAVQSQDYAGAKWAVAQRTNGLTDADLDQAFACGSILRTHVLRPTWHFVTPADIRWLLAVTKPRVHALNAYMYRQCELDETLLQRGSDVLAAALTGGRQLTRAELGETLGQAGIVADGVRLGYIIHYAELEAVICSGARRGKQFTYALLEERAPQAKRLDPDEALAELTKRYFTSHGPATLKDLAWWSSLTLAEAKKAVDLLGDQLVSQVIDEQTYWFSPATPMPTTPPADDHEPQVFLLPNYDEFISYADRSAIFHPRDAEKMDPKKNVVYVHFIVINGQIVGTWQRVFKKGAAVINQSPFRPFTSAEQEAIAAASQRFGAFLGLPVVIR
jgi:hypothetical protein